MARDFQPSAEWRARMDRDCGCALPAQALEAIALFNAGEYYKQHDILEALWMATESPVREAVSCHLADRDRILSH
ncbi:MAG: DUF309 domain-containing protein [Chloroflexi bacterium]|nr:DUF309 domain-containing protein [Chloroflexota bacterium]